MKRKISYIAAAFLISGMLSAQQTDLNAMPKPGPTPTINIAKPKTFQLKNGLTVMVVENHKLPRVNITLTIDRPPVKEGEIAGISSVFAEQIGTGTATLSKDDFNKKVDYLGANLDFSSSGAYANTLSKYFPQVLELMSDAIVHPKFSADEISKTKERQIEGLKTIDKNTQAIAQRVGNALAYGKNTARGEFETEATINKIQLADVQNFYQKYYAPDNAYLVFVGDVKYDKVKKLVEKNFKNWKKSGTVYPALEPATNVKTTEIDIVDVPNAVQSVVSVGNLTDFKMNNPQYFAATIANYILGGGGEARLFMNLREKNGFTYGAYSSLSTSKYSPEFSASASVRNEVTDKAVTEFMNELKGISTIQPDELANAKAKFAGNFIMSLEKPETIARFALNQKIHNLPENFYTDYLKSVDKVTVADVSAAAKEVILPNQERIFVVGKGSDINEGLEKLGYPVYYFDKEANPVAKPTVTKVDASITPASVADRYLAAIGGKDKAEKLNAITMVAAATVQGQNLEMKSIKAKGGKQAQTVSMMGQVMQKIVFDGKTGYQEAMGQKKPLTDEEKSDLLKDTSLFEELGFAANKNLTVTGTENIGGEDSYALKDGDTTYYYSIKTGLKTGQTEVKKAQGQQFTIPTVFSDYKDTDGIKMPYKISQNMGGMDLTFSVKSYELNKATDADFK